MEPNDKPKSELILYTDDSGMARVQVRAEEGLSLIHISEPTRPY